MASHDQNFKNLILDYPRQALAFFASDEAEEIVTVHTPQQHLFLPQGEGWDEGSK